MRFFTRSAQLVRKSHTVMRWTNLLGGIAPNRVWPSTELFKLTRDASGFSYKVLYSFLGNRIGSTDGEFPVAPLTFGPDGALFGTSLGPGFPAGGEAFKFIP
jgi:hypothetical protein